MLALKWPWQEGDGLARTVFLRLRRHVVSLRSPNPLFRTAELCRPGILRINS